MTSSPQHAIPVHINALNITEQAVYRKIALRLVPFLLLCYMLACIDRFNIGFAKLQFSHDLGLNDTVYGIAAGIFYLGNILFEVPSNLWLERIGVRRTLLRIMLFWGAVTCLLMFANGATYLYIFRFLLGVAEAGFFPGVLFYLTFWFPDRLRGRITSMFVMAMPMGGIFAGPMSGWIMTSMNGVGGFHGWQWLFLIEGLPAMAVGVMAYFYLSDNVASAKWLKAKEKEIVQKDLQRDAQTRSSSAKSFRGALRDRKVYILAFIYFSYFCSLTTVLLWTPTLLKAIEGQTVGSVGWISGGISLVSTIGMVLVGYSSDHFLERRWHVAICGFAVAIGLVSLPFVVGNLVMTVALITMASVGVFSILSLFWTIPSAYLNPASAAGSIALISSVGVFGGAVSNAIISTVKAYTGSLYIGLDVIAAMVAISMLTLLVFVPANKPNLRKKI